MPKWICSKTHKNICTEFVTDGYPTFILLRKNHTLVRYKWIEGKENFLGFAESQLKAPEGLGLGLGGKDSDADSVNGTPEESAETKADAKTKGNKVVTQDPFKDKGKPTRQAAHQQRRKPDYQTPTQTRQS